jgi:DNA-directed RNA polymerase subunit RPC12/RpoP
MSLIQRCLPVGFERAERPLRERRKAVLTCPRCEHTSPLDGDWIWTDCDRGTEISCPDCEHLLTVRERFDDSDTSK